VNVGAVVLHYRRWPGVRDTLDALRAQARPPDTLIVVDNHSADGSVDELRGAYPDLEVIEAAANGGYAAGMNLGLRASLGHGSDAVLLLTHECRLAHDALLALVDRLEREPAVGAVGPLIGHLSDPEMVFSAGGEIDRRTWRTDHRRAPARMDDWAGRSPQPAEWLDGAAILLRSAAVEAAGELDEGYFLYFEETEYLLKLRRLGWSVECVPAALAWQESGGKPTYLWVRNRLRFLARTAPKRLVVRELARSVRPLVGGAVRRSTAPSRSERRARTRAILHFLIRRWGPDVPDARPKETSWQPL
jgi:GT2 family glycosyltransferase